MTNYVVAVEGLEALKSLDDVPQAVIRAATRAINKTVDRTRAGSAREMRRQVNFPARYLSGENGRLRVKKKASAASLEGIIEGRHRPTSLARFSSGTPGRGGVSVQVKPGSSHLLKRAFLMKLRAGTDAVDTRFNLGLAIRLKPGESIQNKRQIVKVSSGLYLLYGPSVDQVFRTVAEQEAPKAAAFLEDEFNRLLEL